jgi:uncharacterized protein YukE
MPSYIETLEKIVVRMSKELEQEKNRVAELEKELPAPKGFWVTSKDLHVWQLRQQAKGIEDAANDYSDNLDATMVYLADLDGRVIDLRSQAKELQESSK